MMIQRMLVSRLTLFTCNVRTIKTGKATKQPTAVSAEAKVNLEDTEDAKSEFIESQSRPSMPTHPSHGPSYPPLPRVPIKPQLSKKENLEKIVESWTQQLPHDEDPGVIEDLRSPYEIDKDIGLNSPSYRLFPAEKLIKMHRRYDFSYKAFIKWLEDLSWKRERKDQAFNRMRHGILGPDLACAHFFTNRLGRIKFCGHSEWFTFETSDKLPAKYDEDYLVEKIDATGVQLIYEGLDNMVQLFHLTDLNLTKSHHIDVFGFDKIFRMYRFSTKLHRLNVSHCENFCERSLACCHRIPSLREVIITGTRAAEYKHIKLLVLQLQNIRPNLRVIV